MKQDSSETPPTSSSCARRWKSSRPCGSLAWADITNVSGGRLRPIEIIAKADQVPILEALGFSMRDHYTTKPLSLIVENDDSLLVILVRGSKPVEALRVKKSSFEAVRYLASNSESQ
jgi:hypothetical protein